MPILAGIDVETTGLDVATCHIVEVALVVIEANTSRPLFTGSYLLYDRDVMGDHPMVPEVTLVNGINNHMLATYGAPLKHGLSEVVKTLEHFKVDYLIGHNAEGFDRPILERHHPGFLSYKWVDTRADIEWPGSCHKLGHLAAENGFTNPFPHVAIADVLTMLKLLATQDFAEVVRRAAMPWVKCVAKVSYDEREKARLRRYSWDPLNKTWFKNVKEDKVEQEKAEAPFQVIVVA